MKFKLYVTIWETVIVNVSWLLLLSESDVTENLCAYVSPDLHPVFCDNVGVGESPGGGVAR